MLCREPGLICLAAPKLTKPTCLTKRRFHDLQRALPKTSSYQIARRCLLVCHVQVRSIISSFGVLKAFSLLRDASGHPTGTALAEFTDPGVINPAIAGEQPYSLGRRHAAQGKCHCTTRQAVCSLKRLGTTCPVIM